MKSQKGFSHLVVLIVAVVVIGVVGFAGWRVYDAGQSDNTQTTTSQPSTAQEPTIDSAQDVANAEQELDQLNIDDELDPGALDEDINDLQ